MALSDIAKGVGLIAIAPAIATLGSAAAGMCATGSSVAWAVGAVTTAAERSTVRSGWGYVVRGVKEAVFD